MLFTNIRIEPSSDNPSPAQAVVNAATAALDAANFGLSLFAPWRLVLLAYGVNRSLTRAWFMV